MRKPASPQESLSHCTIWRPSIDAGCTGQRSISGWVEITIPPGCCDMWRGSPQASRASLHQRVPARRAAARHVALDVVAVLPGVHRAGEPLDLARRQPERLGEVAHRRAHLEGREGGHERAAVAAVAVVHARDQHVADVAREVEVDVRQRGELLVEEAAEEQLVLDRVDVREPGEVADDRRHARPAPAAGRQQPRATTPARAPRPPPRARARACRGGAGRSRTGRGGGSRAAPRRAAPPPRQRCAGRRSARRTRSAHSAASFESASGSSEPGYR